MEYLVVVESPSKCKKIQEYLNKVGNGSYKVIASKGHIRAISGLKSIRTKDQYAIDFSIIKGKEHYLDQLKTQILYYPNDRVIMATDNDREGEAIAFHICEVCGLPVETTKRILFNEITFAAIRDAVLHPTIINMNLVLAQHARQVLDVFIGFKISPLLWKHVYSSRAKSLSAGRCQTPALRLVYDNHIECMKCEPKSAYGVVGHFKLLPDGGVLEFRLNREFTGDNSQEEVRVFLAASVGKSYSANVVERPLGVRSAPAPLNTSRLLQVANSMLKMSPKICMDTAQKLYQDGLITYHRTESRKYCKEFLGKAADYVRTRYGQVYLREDISVISNEGDAMPHEAIRVTDLGKREVDGTGASLYKLIWANTVESCMKPAQMKVYHVESPAAMESKFVHVMEIPQFLGWMIVRHSTLGEREKATLLAIQALNGAGFPATKIEANVEMSGFKQHYSESGLIQKLEDLGIGRPSTYAMFVETILERGYVKRGAIDGIVVECTSYLLDGRSGNITTTVTERTFGKENGKLRIQPLGIMCIEFLVKYFDGTFDYGYTKNIEEGLDKFAMGECGKDPWYKICDQVLIDIGKKTRAISSVKKMVIPLDERHELTMQSFGPCVRRKLEGEGEGDGSWEYLPIKPEFTKQIDEFLMNSEDSLGIPMEDLVVYPASYLGKNDEGESVFIKTGPYGHYIECGHLQKSLKDYPIESIPGIDVEEAMHILEGEAKEEGPGILRRLSSEITIRHGKFGSYISYKTPAMKTVRFISLKGFEGGDYMTCDAATLIEWAEEEAKKPKKRAWRGGGGGRGGRGRGRRGRG